MAAIPETVYARVGDGHSSSTSWSVSPDPIGCSFPAARLGSGIAFDDRGSHELKGVPDRWPVLAVRDAWCSSKTCVRRSRKALTPLGLGERPWCAARCPELCCLESRSIALTRLCDRAGRT